MLIKTKAELDKSLSSEDDHSHNYKNVPSLETADIILLPQKLLLKHGPEFLSKIAPDSVLVLDEEDPEDINSKSKSDILTTTAADWESVDLVSKCEEIATVGTWLLLINLLPLDITIPNCRKVLDELRVLKEKLRKRKWV